MVSKESNPGHLIQVLNVLTLDQRMLSINLKGEVLCTHELLSLLAWTMLFFKLEKMLHAEMHLSLTS